MKAEFGRRSRRSMSEINVVPYIDVMLVLLIIFMVTAPMIAPSVIDLPSMAKTAPSKDMQPIEVTVRQTGSLLIKDMRNGKTQESSIKNLGDTVRKMQGDQPERPVVIAAEKNIRYQAVVEAMDTLQQASIEKVGLLVKPQTP